MKKIFALVVFLGCFLQPLSAERNFWHDFAEGNLPYQVFKQDFFTKQINPLLAFIKTTIGKRTELPFKYTEYKTNIVQQVQFQAFLNKVDLVVERLDLWVKLTDLQKKTSLGDSGVGKLVKIFNDCFVNDDPNEYEDTFYKRKAPIFTAINKPNLPAFKLFLKMKKIDVNKKAIVKDERYLMSPLHFMVKKQAEKEYFDLLLKHADTQKNIGIELSPIGKADRKNINDFHFRTPLDFWINKVLEQSGLGAALYETEVQKNKYIPVLLMKHGEKVSEHFWNNKLKKAFIDGMDSGRVRAYLYKLLTTYGGISDAQTVQLGDAKKKIEKHITADYKDKAMLKELDAYIKDNPLGQGQTVSPVDYIKTSLISLKAKLSLLTIALKKSTT